MKKIVFLFILTVFLSSCWDDQEKKIIKNYETVIIGTWTVDLNDKYIWYTKGAKQIMLATKSPGRINYLKKNLWDKVYAWELLASLWSEEAESWYNTAQNIVGKLVTLKQNTTKALDSQIDATKVKIESVKAQIKWINTGLKDTKSITTSQLNLAKANLKETKNELAIKKENILAGAQSSITHTSIISINTVGFVENLLWMDKKNDNFNNKIDNYLWRKDSNQLSNTEELFRKLKPVYLDYKTFYDKEIEDKKPSEQKIMEWLKKAKNLLEKEKKILDETYTVIDNSIENVHMPATMINDLKSKVTTLWQNIEKTLLSTSWETMLWVSWTIENLKNFETQKRKAISILEKQVIQYESMALWKVNNVSTKQQVTILWLKEANSGLKALIAQKNAKLKEIDMKISEALWQKSQSRVMINNWNIIAPFSGIIVNKMSEEWQIINAWMPIYELADNSIIKIKISVPKKNISNLSIWDELNVVVESTNKTYVWKISNISLSANIITKKYEVELKLSNDKKDIPVWEMVVVSFNLEDISNENLNQNIIKIPNSAIIERFMTPWVYILVNNTVEFKQIKILKMWEFYSNVEWLEIWKKIITKWKENIFDWEILK